MQRHLNIPTELLRAVVLISETRSLSKAADRMGLSQPAISAQVKRLQMMVGGSLFERTSTGTTLTALGKLVLQQAKRMLEANDQILMFGRAEPRPEQLKLGISTLFARDFYTKTTGEMFSNLAVQIDKSNPIAKGLLDGYIDVACVYETQHLGGDIERFVVNETSEPLVWVRSRDFVLRPGAPLPIIAWDGDDWMLRTLDRKGIAYRIAANTPDYHAKVVAIEAGTGLSAFPASKVPASVMVAREYYLPQLPPIKSLLCLRENIQSSGAEALLKHLSALFFVAAGASRPQQAPRPGFEAADLSRTAPAV